MKKKLISIFTPVFNEEANLPEVYRQVKDMLAPLAERYDYEHVFSDNGSTDATRTLLKKLHAADPRVKVILLSRNFGYPKSCHNGMLRCHGDAVVHLDGDLQDPVALIPEFIRLWEAGNKVVYGVRADREEAGLMKNARKLFYRIAQLLADEKLIPDVGDFKLVDRRIIEELRKTKDQSPYMRGLIANLGFNQIGLPYVRKARTQGRTSNTIFTLIDYAIKAIISHSTVLLRMATYAGLLTACGSFILVGVYIFLRLISHDVPAGITTIVVLILFFAGLQMIFLGIIGEYIARIFNQSVERPLVVEEELLGFD